MSFKKFLTYSLTRLKLNKINTSLNSPKISSTSVYLMPIYCTGITRGIRRRERVLIYITIVIHLYLIIIHKYYTM